MLTKGYLLLLLADLALGVRIFLHPSNPSFTSSPKTLSPTQARVVVSHHLGLEEFDSVQDTYGVEWLLHGGSFVGAGGSNALLMTMSEESTRGESPNFYALRPWF
jgi:hypothetical protein